MGKRDRERVARIRAGEEKPFLPPRKERPVRRADAAHVMFQVLKTLAVIQSRGIK